MPSWISVSILQNVRTQGETGVDFCHGSPGRRFTEQPMITGEHHDQGKEEAPVIWID